MIARPRISIVFGEDGRIGMLALVTTRESGISRLSCAVVSFERAR